MIKPVVETGTQSPQSTETNWCNIQKFVGTQLRNCSYRVKKSECYEVPSELSNATAPNDPTRCDRFDSDTAPTGIQPQLPPQPPSIPMQIAAPPTSTSKDCHKPMPAPWRNSRNSTRSTPLLPLMPLMRRKVQRMSHHSPLRPVVPPGIVARRNVLRITLCTSVNVLQP